MLVIQTGLSSELIRRDPIAPADRMKRQVIPGPTATVAIRSAHVFFKQRVITRP